MGRTRFRNVFAVGDITTLPAGKAPVPKAGVFAEGEGVVVAGCIVADITGGAGPDPFDGRGWLLYRVGPGDGLHNRGGRLCAGHQTGRPHAIQPGGEAAV